MSKLTNLLRQQRMGVRRPCDVSRHYPASEFVEEFETELNYLRSDTTGRKVIIHAGVSFFL